MTSATTEAKIFSITQSKALAEKIASAYGTKLGKVITSTYSDGEFQPSYEESIRGTRIFIIGSTNPSSENLMEMLLMLDAAKRASARHITAVLPYFGWARQDRKDKPRVAISAKLIANLLTASGATRVITCDLHAGQIQGFFDIPLDNLFSVNELIKDMKEKTIGKNLAIVSPDSGGVVRARAFAKRINSSLVIIDKRRERAGESEVMNIIGEVKNKTCILLDDIVDSGGTLCSASKALKDNGAKEIYSYIVHGVLSGNSLEKIENSEIKELVLTDSIEVSKKIKNSKNIRHISIAPLMGEAIKRINSNSSVSALFE